MEVILRKAAIERGLTRYFTGKPCPHGHVAERLSKSGMCVECNNARKLARYHANRAHCRALNREWMARNRDRVAERNARHAAANADRISQYMAEYRRNKAAEISAASERWRKANGHKKRQYQAKRRAIAIQATPAWADVQTIADFYAEAEYFGYQIDHIVPLQSSLVCGLHVEHNLQAIPAKENAAKGNRYWPDMPQGAQ